MKKNRIIYKNLYEHLTEKWFLKQMGMSQSEMKELLGRGNLGGVAEAIDKSADERGRFSAEKVAEVAEPLLSMFCIADNTRQRMKDAYNYVLGNLFPEKLEASGEAACHISDRESSRASLFLLQLLQAVFRCEEYISSFDPTIDIHFLGIEEIKTKGYNREYLRLREIATKNFIYEFMRMGVELTPFNTLGHIAGVHYVAMHAARQLDSLKVPVDLGLVSGAAAGNDIGK